MSKTTVERREKDGQENGKQKISLHMIVRRNLPSISSTESHEKILEALNKVTHLRLDRENIDEIDHMELFGDSLTNIYLQQNNIRRIENLDFLKNLQFLTLSSNSIRCIEGLSHLQRLIFLDLAHNFIKEVDVDEFPQSLAILNLRGNICTHDENYRQKMIQHLGKLRQLDENEITAVEKRAAGYDVSSSSEDEEDEEEERTEYIPDDIFSLTSSEILLRSQDRMENALFDHKEKRQFLQDLRSSTAELIQSHRKPQPNSF